MVFTRVVQCFLKERRSMAGAAPKTRACDAAGEPRRVRAVNPNGEKAGFESSFFLLPIGFFGYPVFLTHSHIDFSPNS